MPIALPALGGLVLVLWVIAMVLLIAVILGYVAGVLHGLPYPINQLAGPVNSLASGITNVCYKAISLTEKLVGVAFHWLASYLDRVWHSIRTGESFNQVSAAVAHAHAVAINQLAARWRSERAKANATHAQATTLERELHGIDRQLRELERDISKGIGADVLPQIKSLDKRVDALSTRETTDVADARTAADSAISDLWGWLTGVASKPLTLTFAGAVAVALGSLGLGALRCSGFTNLLGKWGCGLGGLLDALLGLVISALALESVCATLPILETAFGDVVGPITHLLTEVPLGGCETPPTGWASLSVKMGPVPPPQTLGALPV